MNTFKWSINVISGSTILLSVLKHKTHRTTEERADLVLLYWCPFDHQISFPAGLFSVERCIFQLSKMCIPLRSKTCSSCLSLNHRICPLRIPPSIICASGFAELHLKAKPMWSSTAGLGNHQAVKSSMGRGIPSEWCSMRSPVPAACSPDSSLLCIRPAAQLALKDFYNLFSLASSKRRLSPHIL